MTSPFAVATTRAAVFDAMEVGYSGSSSNKSRSAGGIAVRVKPVTLHPLRQNWTRIVFINGVTSSELFVLQV